MNRGDFWRGCSACTRHDAAIARRSRKMPWEIGTMRQTTAQLTSKIHYRFTAYTENIALFRFGTLPAMIFAWTQSRAARQKGKFSK
jgi:hypothetical protein